MSSAGSEVDSDGSVGSSAPSSPTLFPKDLPLMDRMNQSMARRAKRVKRAIEKKAKGPTQIKVEDVSALHAAAERGDVDGIKAMLNMSGTSVDVNTRNANGTTLLHTAVRKGDFPMIEYLLAVKGINVNALDNDNKPAITFVRSSFTPIAGSVDETAEDDEGKKGELSEEDEAKVNAILNLLTSHGAMADEEYFKDTAEKLENKLESSDVIDSQLIRKVVVTVALPFIFLVFVNGIWFALKFLTVSVLFYFVAFGYFISEVMLKPPWWFHTPNAKTLRLTGCPDYWEGKLHNPRRDLKLDYTDINVTTHDGINLKGWFIPSCAPKDQHSKMCIVFVHGGGRDRRAWLRHIPFFSKAGYSCILFDMRDHGLSGGPSKGLTFGMRERYDLVAVCAYARERLGFAHVAVCGTSIGASTGIMAAAIDPKIDLVIAENPLLTAAHLQDKHISKIFGPYFNHAKYSEIIFSIFRFMCSNWLNFKLGNKPSKRCQSVHVISKISPRPILLMHGTFDDVVPFYHSETLFSHAKEPKELWLVPEAVHCCLHNKAPEEFEYRVLRFLAKHDPSKPEAERVLPAPPKGLNLGTAGGATASAVTTPLPSPQMSPARNDGEDAAALSAEEQAKASGSAVVLPSSVADPKQKRMGVQGTKI